MAAACSAVCAWAVDMIRMAHSWCTGAGRATSAGICRPAGVHRCVAATRAGRGSQTHAVASCQRGTQRRPEGAPSPMAAPAEHVALTGTQQACVGAGNYQPSAPELSLHFACRQSESVCKSWQVLKQRPSGSQRPRHTKTRARLPSRCSRWASCSRQAHDMMQASLPVNLTINEACRLLGVQESGHRKQLAMLRQCRKPRYARYTCVHTPCHSKHLA